jgi:6-phosphofructokinase 1
MVATSYANIAADLAIKKDYGRLVALRDGKYATVPITALGQGVKRVDVAELYDSNNYRPNVSHLLGKPMFLY